MCSSQYIDMCVATLKDAKAGTCRFHIDHLRGIFWCPSRASPSLRPCWVRRWRHSTVARVCPGKRICTRYWSSAADDVDHATDLSLFLPSPRQVAQVVLRVFKIWTAWTSWTKHLTYVQKVVIPCVKYCRSVYLSYIILLSCTRAPSPWSFLISWDWGRLVSKRTCLVWGRPHHEFWCWWPLWRKLKDER